MWKILAAAALLVAAPLAAMGTNRYTTQKIDTLGECTMYETSKRVSAIRYAVYLTVVCPQGVSIVNSNE